MQKATFNVFPSAYITLHACIYYFTLGMSALCLLEWKETAGLYKIVKNINQPV